MASTTKGSRLRLAARNEAGWGGMTDLTPKFPDVECQLTGEDGNAFAIIGRVSRALKRAGYTEEADAFVKEAMEQESYDHLLRLCMSTVDVS